MFPRFTELRFDWLFDRDNLDPKSKLNFFDTKTNSQTCQPREIVCLTLVISVLQSVLKWCREDSGEEKSHSEVKTNDEFDCAKQRKGSISSVIHCIRKSGKTRQKCQSPLSAQADMYDTMEKLVCRDTSHEYWLVEKAHSSNYSEWNIDKTWSSQEWKSDELMEERTRKLVGCPQRGASQHFVIEDDGAESDLSLGSRSFLHRVNDQVRKRTKTILNGCNRKQWRAFCDMGNVHVFNTVQASVFMVKNYS